MDWFTRLQAIAWTIIFTYLIAVLDKNTKAIGGYRVLLKEIINALFDEVCDRGIEGPE